MVKGKVFIVGVGPGSPEWVSKRVRDVVASAGIVVGWEQDLKPIRDLVKDQRIFLQECRNYLEIPDKAALEAEKTGAAVVVLKTGDPLVAPAGLEGTLKTFEGFEIHIIPGISSVQLAAAKAGIVLTDSAIITYHPLPRDGGRDLRYKRKRMLRALENGLHLLVLTGVRQMPQQTAKYLLDKGVPPESRVVVCENLSYPSEQITKSLLGQVAQMKFNWLSVMVVHNEKCEATCDG